MAVAVSGWGAVGFRREVEGESCVCSGLRADRIQASRVGIQAALGMEDAGSSVEGCIGVSENRGP